MAPPKIPYGGFSPVRFQGRYIRRAFLSITSSSHRAVCLRPSCISLPETSYPRTESRDAVRGCTTVQRLLPLYPRDPRSGPGYVVPVHHRLTGPMRPTPRHSPISPHGGLYALSSLCVILRRLGDPGADPCFCWHTFSTCRPPRPREVHRLLSPSSFTDDAGLRPECRWSRHFQDPPPSDSRGGRVFEASLRFAFAATCRFARPPCRS